MGFFNWAAPMFHRSDQRWTPEDARIIGDWLRPFVAENGRLLDVGGGTGGLAARLSRELRAGVTVLDPTPEMVRYVPADCGVEVVLGVAEAMPLETASFEAALLSDSFHHLRDPRAALLEVARVVRPGGGVLVLELDAARATTRVGAFAERILGEPAGFVTPPELVALMASTCITGTTTPERGASYRFLGTVDSRGDS